jgi:hypothetical protein
LLLKPTRNGFWLEIFLLTDAGTKRPTTKKACPIFGAQVSKHAEVNMRIQHFGMVVLFISIALGAPNVIEFRPIAKPATRAPYTISETITQAKLVRLCDLRPSKTIKLVPAERVSKRIQTLYDADQTDRQGEPPYTPQKTQKIIAGDLARRQEVLEYVIRDQLQTDADFFGTGMIFQHGQCSDSFLLAHQLAGLAIALSESPVSTGEFKGISRWLYAATFDRYLVKNGLPQRFGTQHRFDGPDCWNVLAPFDPNTTSEERAQYYVPTFDPEKARAAAAKCP